MRSRICSCSFALMLALAAVPAMADESGSDPAVIAAEEGGAPASHTILLHAKIGGSIPLSNLEPFASFRLGGGYAPPVLGGRLAVILDLAYTQGRTEGSFADPRIGAAASEAQLSYTMTQRDLSLFLGPQYFFIDPRNWIVPFAAAGLDLHFVQSIVEGTGGTSPLGRNEEVSTRAGFAVRGGAGFRLGPGLLTGELSFGWAPIDHDITGESHLGRLEVLVGYTALIGL